MKTHPGRRLGIAAVFAVLWSVLAIANPTTTYHAAPLIVAVWPALGERNRRAAARMSLGGLLIAAITTGLLSVTGMLQGPSLLPWGGPVLESLLAAGVGALLGMMPAILGFGQAKPSS